MAFHPDSLPNLTGKVFIVTGGNAGMSVQSTQYTNPFELKIQVATTQFSI
jgi:hypothetical protein